MSNKQQIRTKLKDPATEIKTFIGTLIVLLSGLILYADKVINYYGIQINFEFRYYSDLDAFLWTVAGTVSPLMLVFASWFSSKKWAYSSPLSAYSVQLMYVLRDEHMLQREYFWLYTIAFISFFLAMIVLGNKALEKYAVNVYKLKEKIRYLMNVIVVKTRKGGHIVDNTRYTNEIIKPTLQKLDE